MDNVWLYALKARSGTLTEAVSLVVLMVKKMMVQVYALYNVHQDTKMMVEINLFAFLLIQNVISNIMMMAVEMFVFRYCLAVILDFLLKMESVSLISLLFKITSKRTELFINAIHTAWNVFKEINVFYVNQDSH